MNGYTNDPRVVWNEHRGADGAYEVTKEKPSVTGGTVELVAVVHQVPGSDQWQAFWSRGCAGGPDTWHDTADNAIHSLIGDPR